jgi:hypothetical protein
MRAKLHVDRHRERPVRTARTRGMMVGFVGGLVGTIIQRMLIMRVGPPERTRASQRQGAEVTQ